MRFQSIAEAVGRTPLIELKNIGREYGLRQNCMRRRNS